MSNSSKEFRKILLSLLQEEHEKQGLLPSPVWDSINRREVSKAEKFENGYWMSNSSDNYLVCDLPTPLTINHNDLYAYLSCDIPEELLLLFNDWFVYREDVHRFLVCDINPFGDFPPIPPLADNYNYSCDLRNNLAWEVLNTDIYSALSCDLKLDLAWELYDKDIYSAFSCDLKLNLAWEIYLSEIYYSLSCDLPPKPLLTVEEMYQTMEISPSKDLACKLPEPLPADLWPNKDFQSYLVCDIFPEEQDSLKNQKIKRHLTELYFTEVQNSGEILAPANLDVN